jgi:hypothetical protein
MDAIFLEGIAATISAIIVFCGSVCLLLSFVLGARLAYLVTASVTLAFLFMMGLVWSFTPLGPVGQLPEWKPQEVGPTPEQVNFEAISSYPEGPWQPPNQEDQAELTKATELETGATDYLEQQLDQGAVQGIENIDDVTVNSDNTRLLMQGEDEYGAVQFDPLQGEGPAAIVVMRYDPGNPLGLARGITLGTLILFVLHLIALSLSERRAARVSAPTPMGGRP